MPLGNEIENRLSVADSIIEQLNHINPLVSEFEIISLIESSNHSTVNEKMLIIRFILESGAIQKLDFANGEEYWCQQYEKLEQHSTHGVSWMK